MGLVDLNAQCVCMEVIWNFYQSLSWKEDHSAFRVRLRLCVCFPIEWKIQLHSDKRLCDGCLCKCCGFRFWTLSSDQREWWLMFSVWLLIIRMNECCVMAQSLEKKVWKWCFSMLFMLLTSNAVCFEILSNDESKMKLQDVVRRQEPY